MDRRRFLGASTAIVAASGCSGNVESGDAGSEQSLPPSLAVLESIRERALPITRQERQARVEKARQIMAGIGADAMLLTGGTSLVYFSGVSWGVSERLFAAILPVEGAASVVCPAFERDRALEQLESGSLAGAEVRTWHEHEDPYAVVAGVLRDRGIATGRLAVEETVRFVFSDGISKASPALSLMSATPVTAGCRGVKDAHEIELMRLASEATLKAYEAAYHAMTEGMTQNDFARLVSQAHNRLGFNGDRWWLYGRGLPVGHQQNIRAGRADAEDEGRVRHRAGGADGGPGSGEARCGMSGRGRCGEEGHYRRRLRPRLHLLHSPRRPRHWNGRP
jgi:Xaa-Pro dipeptidase